MALEYEDIDLGAVSEVTKQEFDLAAMEAAGEVTVIESGAVSADEMYDLSVTAVNADLGVAVDWGDGSIDVLSGETTSISHTYTEDRTNTTVKIYNARKIDLEAVYDTGIQTFLENVYRIKTGKNVKRFYSSGNQAGVYTIAEVDLNECIESFSTLTCPALIRGNLTAPASLTYWGGGLPVKGSTLEFKIMPTQFFPDMIWENPDLGTLIVPNDKRAEVDQYINAGDVLQTPIKVDSYVLASEMPESKKLYKHTVSLYSKTVDESCVITIYNTDANEITFDYFEQNATDDSTFLVPAMASSGSENWYGARGTTNIYLTGDGDDAGPEVGFGFGGVSTDGVAVFKAFNFRRTNVTVFDNVTEI